MNEQNLILRAAVLATLGAVAGQANAQVDLSSPTAVKFASELPITSTTTLALLNSAGALDIRVPAITGIKPTNANPVYIKLALSNGAKFATAPTVSCSGNTAAGAGQTSFTGAVSFGGAGQSTVTFTLTASNDGTAAAVYMTGASACTISGHTVSASGSLGAINVSATYEYTNGAVATVSGFSGAYITFARGFTATVSANTASNLTVDAINGATRYTAGGPAITSASAILGLVRTVGNGTAFSADGASTLSAGDVFTAATLTVAGNAIAAALTNGSSGIFLSNDAGCAAVSETLANSAASSVTFNVTAGMRTQLSAASGYTVCANVSGNTTQITTGTMTATLSGATGVSNVTADLSASSNNLVTVAQNGASMNAYFINASTSSNKTSVVRVINNNSSSAAVKATAYAEDGTVLGTASASVGTASANGMLTLTSADIETALGFTPSSGTVKYRVLFTANVSGFKVINFTRDVASGNLTLSQQQDN